MAETLRVATLNIWCRHGDWAARRDVLRDGFRLLKPDLIALQETVVTDDSDQTAELFGDDYHVLHQGRRTPEGVGCSIVSRWPAVAVEEIDLCVTERVDPQDFPGRSTAAEFDTPVGPVLFVNHKPNWQVTYEHERELQAVAAARAIERLVAGRDLHVVLAGDFDARPETSSVRFWTGRQSLGDLSVNYQDVWEFAHPGDSGHTFTLENPLIVAEADWGRIPPRRIDYIMVRCDVRGPTLRIHSAERLFDRPVRGVFGTDHFGVIAELEQP
ncbi:endonuclease/exonuclease/phosphatase family protein [Kribbella sp. NPDC023972]|uniref:endonuclease/exonuclease/phosphatase family protein n=1 Tax=Kribbella sp. NPDC023972 TaxID=3154795 RepID=UPI0033F21AFF